MGPEVVCGVREFDVGRSGVPTVPGDIVIGELQNSYKPVTKQLQNSYNPVTLQSQCSDRTVTKQLQNSYKTVTKQLHPWGHAGLCSCRSMTWRLHSRSLQRHVEGMCGLVDRFGSEWSTAA